MVKHIMYACMHCIFIYPLETDDSVHEKIHLYKLYQFKLIL